MEVVVARCAGLDVHQKTVMACIWTPAQPSPITSSRLFRGSGMQYAP